MRNLIIYAPYHEIKEIKKIIDKYKNEFKIRNVIIKFKDSNKFFAELYGYDGELKKKIRKISEIPKILIAIDNMLMGSIEKKFRKIEKK